MVDQVIRVLETSTGTAVVETDAGTGYLKALGNPEGPHALVCELIGTRLAAFLGLQTLDWALVNLPQGKAINYSNGTHSKAGTAFVTRDESASEESSRPWDGTEADLECLENPSDLAGLVVLDTWTRNCDRFSESGFAGEARRNLRNVLLSPVGTAPGMLRLLAIDHTHCFTCGREITPRIANLASVRDSKLYGLFPEFSRYVSREAVKRPLERAQTLSREAASRITAVPADWGLGAEAREALGTFLLDRAIYLGENLVGSLAARLDWR